MAKTELRDGNNKVTITLDGDLASLALGDNDHVGQIQIKDKHGKIVYFAAGAIAFIGNTGSAGQLHIASKDTPSNAMFPTPNISLDGDKTVVTLKQAGKERIKLDGIGASVWIGGNDSDGDLVLFGRKGDNTTLGKATIHLNGQTGNCRLGGPGASGNLLLYPDSASALETSNPDNATIHLDGKTGDILLKNADCAEEFDLAKDTRGEPGDVMVFDENEAIQACTRAYDTRSAGVISGAGEYQPAIVLDKRHSSRLRRPLALMGKVYCKVDASYHPISAGDLLTTSETEGHAMKAVDSTRAFGAVIGKALRSISKGRGVIPILVSLQ